MLPATRMQTIPRSLEVPAFIYLFIFFPPLITDLATGINLHRGLPS